MFGAFLGPQDGAKIDPRSAQDGLKTDLKRDRFFPEALRLGFPLVVFVASGTAFTSAPGAAGAPITPASAGVEFSFSAKDFHQKSNDSIHVDTLHLQKCHSQLRILIKSRVDSIHVDALHLQTCAGMSFSAKDSHQKSS